MQVELDYEDFFILPPEACCRIIGRCGTAVAMPAHATMQVAKPNTETEIRIGMTQEMKTDASMKQLVQSLLPTATAATLYDNGISARRTINSAVVSIVALYKL